MTLTLTLTLGTLGTLTLTLTPPRGAAVHRKAPGCMSAAGTGAASPHACALTYNKVACLFADVDLPLPACPCTGNKAALAQVLASEGPLQASDLEGQGWIVPAADMANSWCGLGASPATFLPAELQVWAVVAVLLPLQACGLQAVAGQAAHQWPAVSAARAYELALHAVLGCSLA